MTKKFIRNYVKQFADKDREYIDGTREEGVARISMYQAGVPHSERAIEIRRSPWWRKNKPDYQVRYLHEEKVLGSENGLNMNAVINAVLMWDHRQGWM